MTLTERAAAALDRTHNKTNFHLVDETRAIIARWLDGKIAGKRSKLNISFVRKSVAFLEMVAR